ncbi:PhoH family protein [gamma proteobacterium HTCC5015]|nr:PhoH family protein [gamma proteobacterium HTCC5015]
MVRQQRLFVLDSSVLIHDPAALFRFEEHDIYIPMMVLEELDASKKGHSEVSRNARQASRFFDELIRNNGDKDISDGLELAAIAPKRHHSEHLAGKLYFQTQSNQVHLPDGLPHDIADNKILSAALCMAEQRPERGVVLVSKDTNLRIKATVVGLSAEDYFTDQALDDLDLLHSGIQELPEQFWNSHSKEMESWNEGGSTYYRIRGDDVKKWYPNLCLHVNDDSDFKAMVREVDGDSALIEYAKDYSQENHCVWGINARNMGQNFALNLLMDPEVDFVSLMGMAGTGKTLMTLAAALTQTLDLNRYREIIMTRVTVAVGEDIGFLPGTEEEKMTPWMGALMDNLEVLTQSEHHSDWERQVTSELVKNRIKVRSLNFMRGRTFLNKFIIIDEAQNLTSKQMKTLITRAGPGTKVVCLGNAAQIDTPYLTGTTSGLTYAVDRFKNWAHSGHITLTVGERSRLADFAAEAL